MKTEYIMRETKEIAKLGAVAFKEGIDNTNTLSHAEDYRNQELRKYRKEVNALENSLK